MLEKRYQHRTIPWESEKWPSFIAHHQRTRIISGAISDVKEYRVDPKETLSPEAKLHIFGEPTANLCNFLQTRNIAPPSDSLAERLMIVNSEDYTILCITGRSDPGYGTLGARLPKRLSTVNADAIARKAIEHKINFEDLLCLVGTHEIAHTLTYQESWAERKLRVDDGKIFRRDGIITGKPPIFADFDLKSKATSHSVDRRRIGLNALSEGLTQYVVMSCISTKLRPLFEQTNPYTENLYVMKTLIYQIGEEPFIQAMFTKVGFRGLYLAVEQKYGRGQFNRLLTVFNGESNQSLTEQLRSTGFVP